MNNTWRQFISDIQTSIRAVNSDGFIPPRFIYYEAQSIIADFLKKDQDAKKKLQRISEGWSTIDCVDLEEIPVIECADIDVRLCDKMMRSVNRLPNIHTYSYGNIIKHVASVNFAYFFEPTNPKQWNNIQKRQYKDKNKYYYYILDNYIYLPIPKSIDLPIEVLRIDAYFMDKHDVDKFKALKKCSECPKGDLCTSPLDYEVVIPSYLVSAVKTELLNKLLSVYLKLSPDTYANLNEIEKSNNKDLQTYETP